MFTFQPRSRAALLAAALFAVAVPGAWGQNAGEQKPPEQAQKPPANPPADAAKEEKKKVDEFAEAARLLPGAAGQPECVWIGRRVVDRLWRDDLDAALRQLELYDRFGCPGDHLQQAFRCVARQGEIDKKSTDTIALRIQACWLAPSLPPVIAAPANGTPPAPSSQ
jgi:nucleoid-associated protein YgaU